MIRISGDPYLKEYQKSYERWYERHGIETIDVEQLRIESKSWKHRPLFSILTPIYNTNHQHLKECVHSVRAQAYENWELILVDDNSSDPEIWPLLQEFANTDKRIKIKHRTTNGHICVASNDALAMAKGEWIALLDHDDVLWPNALHEVVKRINEKPTTVFVYSDEDKIAEDGHTHCDPFFKPDWSPHFLWSCNYITHFAVLQKSLVEKIGGFREKTHGAQDWDLFLRAIEHINGYSQHPWDPKCQIQHIDTILYSWRKSETSTASEKHSLTAKDYAYTTQEKVLADFFSNRGGAVVTPSRYLGIYNIEPYVLGSHLVSIIIPTKDRLDLIERLIESIKTHSTNTTFEIIIVSNNSTAESNQSFSKLLEGVGRVVECNETFNFSKLCNLGAKQAKGDVLLFMNNDSEVLEDNWIDNLLAFAVQPEVGAIGPRLLYPNGRIQNNGLVFAKQIHHEAISTGDFVAPYFRNSHPLQNFGVGTVLLSSIRDYSAITGAVFMIEKYKFEKIKGWNEDLAVAFNDVDLCLKLQQAGYFCLINPNVTVLHHESVSVGQPSPERQEQMEQEESLLKRTWSHGLDRDVFLSSHLQLESARPKIFERHEQ